MNQLLIYLLKVATGSAIFYLLFILIFRKDTFYIRNRFVLLLSMIIPATVPFIMIQGKSILPDHSGSIFIIPVNGSLGTGMLQPASAGSVGINDILFWIWIIVCVILLLKTAAGVYRAVSIIKSCKVDSIEGQKFFVSDLDHPPFSFWNAIVIPERMSDRNELRSIVTHEKVHVNQFHTLDLLISEIFIAFFWFNPVSWFIKKSLIMNHEYFADRSAIRDLPDASEYQYRLISIPSLTLGNSLVHNFNSHIKNRIVMINKKPTLSIAILKNLLILPALLLSLLFVSFKPGDEVIQNPQESQPLFSNESHKALMKFLFENVQYPEIAKENGITGRFYVIVTMGKGGKVINVITNDKDRSIDVPLISSDEIVIVGYGSEEAFKPIVNEPGNDFTALRNEGIRIGNLLGSLDLPEWKNKAMTFAFSMNFQLKNPVSEPGVTVRAIDNSSGLNPLFIVDGKEVSADEIKNISPNSILSINVLKDESAFKKYGEKGKNGVIEITLK